MLLEGKSFIITGGLGSIGGASAKLIVEKGGYAVLFDILSNEDGQKRIAAFPNADKYFYQQVDIANKEKMMAACEWAVKTVPKGSLFGAVHCAGINPNRSWTHKMVDKLDDFETVLRVNAFGTFCVNACVAEAINSQYPPLDIFAERVSEERGCIINLSSVVASNTPARCLTYGPSKTCVLGITNAAADFLAPSGIRVNSVAPALVFSQLMNSGGRAEYFKEELETQSMFPRRFTEPAEIAHGIVFLLENSMMNAFHLKVDAGWRMISHWGLDHPTALLVSAHSDGERGEGPPPKKRKMRPQLNCNECRRLKAKCDRILEDLLGRNGIVIPDDPTASPPPNDAAAHTLASLSSTLADRAEPTQAPANPSPNPPTVSHSVSFDANLAFSMPGPSQTSFSPHDIPQVGPSPVGSEEQSVGTLVISRSGKSKYLGPTAASEWLKNQEEIHESISRPLSPLSNPNASNSSNGGGFWASDLPANADVGFPYNTAGRTVSTAALLGMLPPREDGEVLLNSYYRHFSWQSVSFAATKIFDKAYSLATPEEQTSLEMPPCDLGLLFSIFAMGSYYNLELPPDDSSVEECLKISKCCLAKGDFMANNTISAIQSLLIMGHLQLSMESGNNGDAAWPLWGITSRMIMAMGLHRDGEKWNLPTATVEERRRVFWECHATDVMTSNCFSRPGAMNPLYIDTALPSLPLDDFHRSKFSLSFIFDGVLDHAMKVVHPPYSNVQALNEQIINFERNVPYNLRCRPVLSVLLSTYPSQEIAAQASPALDKRNLHLTFQQFTLAMNLCELLVFLHRPYFARAINESPQSPERSVYGLSYLAVVERCNYHAFNSAACVGSLVLKNPQSSLAHFAINIVDSCIASYTSVVWSRNSPRMTKNLKWLVKLREKIGVKMAQIPEIASADGRSAGEQEHNEDDDDVELLGWRTRLIERDGQNSKSARTIPPLATFPVAPVLGSWPMQG
ncbi:hypothetical protein MNV49_001805 [Pseudohyphozyma bogoriensis]|nr:hypothetical protein MNV49_001805 [Pseudohyphozyma bogoriensis]